MEASVTRRDNQRVQFIRVDDIDYAHARHLAIPDCLPIRIIKSAAILVITPWFEKAAMIARENSDFCFGVHLGITGECRGYPRRPLLAYSDVRSLVDEACFLLRSPGESWAHNPDMKELKRNFVPRLN